MGTGSCFETHRWPLVQLGSFDIQVQQRAWRLLGVKYAEREKEMKSLAQRHRDLIWTKTRDSEPGVMLIYANSFMLKPSL